VIVPEGKEGDRLLEAMAPLIRLREEEQGAEIITYRVPPDMNAKDAVSWKDEVYWSEDVEEDDRPLYLMLLGDLDQVSLELQHSLANCALVGRAHFANAKGKANLDNYAAYAAKVVGFAQNGTLGERPDMLFHIARDGTNATQSGEARLLNPCLEAAMKNRDAGRLPVTEVCEIEAESTDEFLAAGANARPSVLLSVSHGVGAPRKGWSSEEEQWRKQGALVMGHHDVLDAERLGTQTFLPGGLWFLLACFGAGTPNVSAYHAWLSLLAQEGKFSGKANSVLASLPAQGARPFVAALPQAALANPNGPLAIIGHMDLAWTYGFSSATNLSESRKSRFYSVLEVMARGSRAGVGIEALMRFYRETNDALMAGYQAEADARAHQRDAGTNKAERGHLWMLRNDLRGYVLLGDPATRLPLAKNALGKPDKPDKPMTEPVITVNVPPPVDVSVALKEAAVLSLIHGEEAPIAIARRAGTTVVELFSWFDAYRSGGRSRL
ncbi:MAG TPA: hypothetical protein PK156_37900, partial [Polyangium sp.]|nr:hypothetical protein [Polyangium sp.]